MIKKTNQVVDPDQIPIMIDIQTSVSFCLSAKKTFLFSRIRRFFAMSVSALS